MNIITKQTGLNLLSLFIILNTKTMGSPTKKQKTGNPNASVELYKTLAELQQFKKLADQIELGNITYIKKWLETNPDIGNMTNFDEQTLAHIATEKIQFDILKLLLENGANPNQQDSNDNSPLNVIFSEIWDNDEPNNKKIEILDLLISHGADIDIQNNKGNSELHESAFYGIPEQIHFLLTKKANPNLTNKLGQKPIDLATNPMIITMLRDAMQQQ